MQISSFNTNEVEVNSVYFRSNSSNKRFESYPKSMIYEGREYNFLEDSLRYLINSGQKLIKLFDVSDGATQYRLKLDEANHWTLINSRAC
jgi:hypothetical protein